METIVLGGKVIQFVGAVGTDLIFTAVRTTSSGVINGVHYISSSDKNGISSVKTVLEELDISNKINVISTFAHELDGIGLPESIKLGLVSVENMIFKIENEIKEITKKIEQHNQLWFSYYRSLDCSVNLANIKVYKQILDDRMELLLRLLQVDKSRYHIIKQK